MSWFDEEFYFEVNTVKGNICAQITDSGLCSGRTLMLRKWRCSGEVEMLENHDGVGFIDESSNMKYIQHIFI